MDLHAVVMDYIKREIIKDDDIEVTNEEPLITGGLIDSFDLVKLAVFIEQKCGVKIDDSLMSSPTMDTIDQIVKVIESEQK